MGWFLVMRFGGATIEASTGIDTTVVLVCMYSTTLHLPASSE